MTDYLVYKSNGEYRLKKVNNTDAIGRRYSPRGLVSRMEQIALSSGNNGWGIDELFSFENVDAEDLRQIKKNLLSRRQMKNMEQRLQTRYRMEQFID